MKGTLAHMEISADGGVGGDGGTGADSRPEWLPDQFKQPEDVVKSWEESRKEMDRLRSQLDQERAQFSEALERIESVQAPVVQQQGQGNDLLAAYQQAAEAGDETAKLAITLQLQQAQMEAALEKRFEAIKPQLDGQSKADREIAFRMAEERIQREYGDGWDKIAPAVDNLLKERPHWQPQSNSPDAWAAVLREAAQVVQSQQIVADQVAAERDRNAKLSAQTAESSGVSRFPIVTDEKAKAWAEIKEAPVGGFSDIARKR